MVVDGDIGIKRARSFYEQLKNELESNTVITLDFSQVKRVDLSILQIIMAAGREARGRGKTIKMKSVCDDVKRQMQMCGLRA